MIATIEFQISATRFAAAVLSTLKNNPRCLPGPLQGLQLQRVRFRSASIRNDKTASFRVWQEMGPWDQGLGWEWFTGKVAQLAVDVTLDITTTASIIANPNTLSPPIAQPDATILLDLECEPHGGGRLAISYSISGVEAPALNLPGIPSFPDWASAQLNTLLNLEPIVIDLTNSIAHGKQFMNAGLAVDSGGTRLVIRAEVASGGFNYWPWRKFRNGEIPDRLGPHDWSVFLSKADLNHSLVLPISQAIRDGLKNNAHRLVTIDFSLEPQPGYAVITLTPYFDIPVLGVTAVPIELKLSIDAASGTLIVELNAYGIRDLVSDLKFIAYIVINLLLPIVGWFVFAALNDVIGDAMKLGSTAGAGAVQDGLDELDGAPAGTTFLEIPGQPFRYRASIPVAVPSFVDGAFESLVASSDGIALAGRWRVLNFVEGEMTVGTSDFGWQAPKIPCGAAGERVLHDFEENAKQYAWLYAQVSMSSSGSAQARLCTVTVIDGPSTSTGLQISWQASEFPTLVTLTAPSSYSDIAQSTPIRLEVRTTLGVFQVSIPHPRPLTATDIRTMRSLLVARLKLCDAIVLKPWFEGVGRFDLSWIENPLHDPDFGHSWLSLIEIDVKGLAEGASLNLSDSQDRMIAKGHVGSEGRAKLTTVLGSGMPALFASVEGFVTNHYRSTTVMSRSFNVTRELFELRGTMRLPAPARAIFAPHTLGSGTFLVAFDESLVVVDATMPSRPLLGSTLNIRGASGVVETKNGMLIFGAAGLFAVGLDGSVSPIDREPILDVVRLQKGLAILKHGRLIFSDLYAVSIFEERVNEELTTLGEHYADSKILSQDRIDTSRRKDSYANQPLNSMTAFGVARVVRSSIDGRHYGKKISGEYIEIDMHKEPYVVATYLASPWQARAVRSGHLVLDPGKGVMVRIYRSTGAREVISAQGSIDDDDVPSGKSQA